MENLPTPHKSAQRKLGRIVTTPSTLLPLLSLLRFPQSTASKSRCHSPLSLKSSCRRMVSHPLRVWICSGLRRPCRACARKSLQPPSINETTRPPAVYHKPSSRSGSRSCLPPLQPLTPCLSIAEEVHTGIVPDFAFPPFQEPVCVPERRLTRTRSGSSWCSDLKAQNSVGFTLSQPKGGCLHAAPHTVCYFADYKNKQARILLPHKSQEESVPYSVRYPHTLSLLTPLLALVLYSSMILQVFPREIDLTVCNSAAGALLYAGTRLVIPSPSPLFALRLVPFLSPSPILLGQIFARHVHAI